MMSLEDAKLSLRHRVAAAEAECTRLRNELRDRDTRYEEQALLLQERMQAAEEEAQARGERLAEAQKRLAELAAQRPAPDPGAPIRLTSEPLPDGQHCVNVIYEARGLGFSLLVEPEVEAILRELVRAHNILHGEDDEDDRAFGVALHEAAGRMYRRQADKAARRVIHELIGERHTGKVNLVSDIIYEEMGAGSLVRPEDEGEEAEA